MNNLWDAFKQYLSDAAPGGALNPEVTPQGVLDTLAMSTMAVPVVGDVAGGVADAYRYAKNPEERTPGNFALSAMGLLPFVPGTFIGPSAKAWDSNMAFEAQKMLKRGEAPELVWEKTGTFRSPDGLLRQEIDDSASQLLGADQIKQQANDLREQTQVLQQAVRGTPGQKDLFPKQLAAARAPAKAQIKQNKEVLSSFYGPDADVYRGNLAQYAYKNDELYDSYPQLKDIVIRQGVSGRPGLQGSFSGNQLDVTSEGIKKNPRSTVAHEMQHAIQDIEGFGRGGSAMMAFQDPAAFKILDEVRAEVNTPMPFAEFRSIAKYDNPIESKAAYEKYKNDMLSGKFNTPELERELQNVAAQRYYKRLAGEAEARAVQNRLNLTKSERKARFPLLDYDVEPDKVIPKHVGQFYDNLIWDF